MKIILYRDLLGKILPAIGIKYNKLAIDLPEYNGTVARSGLIFDKDALLTVKDNAVDITRYKNIKSNIAVFTIRNSNDFLFRFATDMVGKQLELTPIEFLDKIFVEGYNLVFHELNTIDVTKIYEYLNNLGNFVQLSYEGPVKDYVKKEKIY